MKTYRTLFHILSGLLLLALLAQATPAIADDDSTDYVPGEVVIYLRNGADLPAIAAAFNLNPAPLDQFGNRPIYRMAMLGSGTPPQRAEALEADQRVRFAEPNYLFQVPEGRPRGKTPWAGGGTSDNYTNQWAVGPMRLNEAHTVTKGNSSIVVAVLDNGIDPTQPKMAGNLV
nr:hypothetical protein [Chloroflexaceae bacterium]